MSDNDENAWYYYEVEEATNTHEYEIQSDGVNGNWKAILSNHNWQDLKKQETEKL